MDYGKDDLKVDYGNTESHPQYEIDVHFFLTDLQQTEKNSAGNDNTGNSKH